MISGVRWVIGRAGTGKTRFCLDEVVAETLREPEVPCVLLVPDQASFLIEKELAELMPGEGVANVQVYGMTRFAYRVLQARYSGSESLSQQALQLVMHRALKKVAAELTVLGKAARRPQFAEMLLDEYQDMSRYGISTKGLLQEAYSWSPSLREKLSDSDKIFSEYESYLADHFPGSMGQMDKLPAEIRDSTWLANAKVWVDGFLYFTPQDQEIITALKDNVRSLMITLLADEEDWQKPRETSLFHQAYRSWQKLSSETDTLLYLKDRKRWTGAGLAALEKGYFALPAQKQKEPSGEICLTEAHNPEEEVRDALAEAMRLVRDEGYRWRDISFLVRNHSVYTDFFERECERNEIPYFTDRKRSMAVESLAVFWDRVVQLATYGWDTENVIRLLKSGLLPVSIAEVEELEIYCREFGIQKRHWYIERRWEYRHRRQIDHEEEVTEAQEAQWGRVDSVRRRLQAWLVPLMRSFSEKATVKQRATALFNWSEEVGLQDRLVDLSRNRTEEFQRSLSQVYGRILQLLDTWVQVAGDDVWDAEEFATLWHEMLQAQEYTLIPPTLDHLTLTTIERGYTQSQPIVFVLGHNEGIFPARPEERGLWTDRDRRELSAAQVAVGPDSIQRALQERLWVYLAWTRAGERLYLSYAAGDSEGQKAEPAFMARRLLQLGYTKLRQVETNPEEDWQRPRQALAQLPGALAAENTPNIWYALYDWALEHGYADLVYDYTRSLFFTNKAVNLEPPLSKELYAPKGTFRGSVTAFETYRNCPFRFFASYGLRLDELAEAKLDAADIGTYLHAGLAHFGDKLLQEGRQWRDLSPAEIAEQAQAITDLLAPRMANEILGSDARHRNIRRQLDRTLVRTVERLKEWSGKGEFATTALEKPFQINLGQVDGIKFNLVGTIDRLDVYHDEQSGRDYYLIIDYKTGNTTVSVADIYYGLRLQLATYLHVALIQKGKSVPAGIMYVYVRDEVHTTNRPMSEEERREYLVKALRAQGFFLGDREVLAHIDQDTELSFLPVQIKKDGTFSKASKVADERTLRNLATYVVEMLPRLCAEILGGCVDITPIYDTAGGACKYCQYRMLCGFDPGLAGNDWRFLRKISEEEALQEIEKHVEEGAEYGLD